MDNNIEVFDSKVNTEYSVNQISSLSGLSAIQKRPGMYIGTTSQMGLNVLVREIWDNSVDEYTAGFGNEIDIEIFEGGRVRVIDHGRGIPVGPHPEWKKPDGTPLDTLTGILTILHAGGKFGEEGSGYKSSAGLHGIGSKCANALSKELIATVKRDGKIYQQTFNYGNPITEVEIIGTCDKDDTGTTIEYEPDPNIFKQTVLPNCNALQGKIDEVTSLNGGLIIKYKNHNTNVEKTFHHPDGIKSYVRDLVKDKKKLFNESLSCSRMVKVDDKYINVEISFIYDDEDKPSETFKTFANNVNTTEGGYHLTGFRDSFKKCMNEFIIKNNLSKNEVELRYLLDGICCIISVRVPEAEFEGQTKNKLGNIEAKTATANVVEIMFKELYKERFEDFKLIADRAIKVKIAEEAARKARQNARAANKVAKTALPGKLADCSNRNGYTELYLVEGDSAAGCHTYDTKVKLADGRNLEIGKIVEEFNNGKKNYVYSCDENGRITIQPIVDAFITKKNTQVIRLTLDNGEQIKCTPEHPYMLRNGEYKEAQYLTKEDSLMPIYVNYSNHPFMNNFNINKDEQKYEFIKMNDDNKWYATHRVVAEQYHGIKPNNMHTHHKDINSLNNIPENLIYMDATEHLQMHADIRKNDENYIKLVSENTKKQWQNEDFRRQASERSRQQMLNGGGLVGCHRRKLENDPEYFERNWKKLHGEKQSKKRKESLKKYYNEHEEVREKLSQQAKEQWNNEELRKWRAEKTREQMNDLIFREKRRKNMMQNRINKALNIVNSMINDEIEFNKDNYEEIRRQKSGYKFIASWKLLLEKYGNVNNIIEEAKTFNHKVVKIEWLEEKEDVYDITVPPYANFALSAGIFVHNSAKMGRFSKFQAILPLRGKVLNVEKVEMSRVLESDAIKSIIAAIGTGIGAKFDIKKSRYDKILLMTDADVDGSHIRILLLTFFYNYMRPLLEEGYIYCTQPPLFRVEFTNKKYQYVKDDEELKEVKKKYGKKIADVQRFKG